jgi:hypothetical protein
VSKEGPGNRAFFVASIKVVGGAAPDIRVFKKSKKPV